jgi:hypothetical protein
MRIEGPSAGATVPTIRIGAVGDAVGMVMICLLREMSVIGVMKRPGGLRPL